MSIKGLHKIFEHPVEVLTRGSSWEIFQNSGIICNLKCMKNFSQKYENHEFRKSGRGHLHVTSSVHVCVRFEICVLGHYLLMGKGIQWHKRITPVVSGLRKRQSFWMTLRMLWRAQRRKPPNSFLLRFLLLFIYLWHHNREILNLLLELSVRLLLISKNDY